MKSLETLKLQLSVFGDGMRPLDKRLPSVEEAIVECVTLDALYAQCSRSCSGELLTLQRAISVSSTRLFRLLTIAGFYEELDYVPQISGNGRARSVR